MNVDPISTGTGTASEHVRQAVARAGGQTVVQTAIMSAGAKAMGITLSELRAAVARGQSLSSIAAAHNVSVATLQAMMASAATKADPSLGGSQAQQLVQRVINGRESTANDGTLGTTLGR